MTREEAAWVLEEIWKRYTSKVDDIEEREVDAIFAAIDALREQGQGYTMTADRLPDGSKIVAQPDPETGLVPCGCGGKAGFHYSVMLRDNDCCVACGICGVHSKVALCEEEARDAWNKAMGGQA